MQAIRIHAIIEKDGEIQLKGLPFKRGEQVEMIVINDVASPPDKPALTAESLLHSGLIGLWADRTDITDSSVYARQLREQAQIRKWE